MYEHTHLQKCVWRTQRRNKRVQDKKSCTVQTRVAVTPAMRRPFLQNTHTHTHTLSLLVFVYLFIIINKVLLSQMLY